MEVSNGKRPERNYGWVLAASLWSVDTEGNPVKHESALLAGTQVSECKLLHDNTGSIGCYFVFSELAVRREGKFRLLFTLVNTMK